MPIQVPPSGPSNAKIMIVGEAPGADEEREGQPFVGASGQELNRMLQEAGISRSECFVTNVCRERPLGNDISTFIAMKKKDITNAHIQVNGRWVLHPIRTGLELLSKEIEMVKPNVVIAFGNTPLWALSGHWGITKWRGSMLYSDLGGTRTKFIPTLHPAAILRQWSDRATAVNDLKRAARFRDGQDYPKPQWQFTIRPSFEAVRSVIGDLTVALANHNTQMRLSFDLETRAGHIACAGISWSLTDAICIPFMCVESQEGYWSEAEEAQIVFWLAKILTHPNAAVVGQNILYDSQYTWRHWHFVPNVVQDCMIAQHTIFSDQPKSLAYQASMYCDYYVYWKQEGKDWAKGMGEDQLWNYNCLDCVYTDECGLTELETVKKLGLEGPYETQQALFWPVLKCMQQGVKIDTAVRSRLIEEVQHEVFRREEFLFKVLGHEINPRSPKQMMTLFYEDLKQPIQMTRASKGVPARPTLNDDALQKLAVREPLLKPLINAISDIRTLGIFLSNFLCKPLDEDGRMRCAYNIGGSASGKSAPVTYRLSSSENAFGSGTNLQNIPSEKSKSVGKAAARGGIAGLGDAYAYPNIRSMFIPDYGYSFWNGDLDRADLQVFVWEIDDEDFKLVLKMGADAHLFNAYTLEGREPPPLEELVETHPKYQEHRRPMKLKREFAKSFCHATDYVGSPRTIAAAVGWTVQEVDRAQKIYLGAHPKIRPYWQKVEAQIRRFRFVENKFGYRWYIFDRVDNLLPEAVAWIPQSTVSVLINKIWLRLYKEVPEVEVLLQVHDSLAGQIRTPLVNTVLTKIKEAAKIVVPYDDPLIIPFSISTSELSWGDC